MSTKEDRMWRALLATSAPAFAGEVEPPYGFATQIVARARAERQEQDVFERIGLRAIFASLAVVVFIAAVTAGLQLGNYEDMDPGIKSMALVENVQVS